MTPLVRILIRNGVSYGEFAEVLKNIFVEIAERDFGIPGRRPSQSRVAILTGLTRKEVAKQKSILEGGTLVESSNLNRVTRVLEGWHTDSDYTGPYGLPMELSFESDSSRSRTGISFVALVRKYSGDMAPRAMLDELLRVGAVELTSAGNFRVLMRSYIPASLHPDALERLGTVVNNFVTTYEYNMTHREQGGTRFERVVYADKGLRADLMPAFDKLIRTKGLQLLIELDNWLSAQEISATAKLQDPPRVNTGVGIYHFVEQEK